MSRKLVYIIVFVAIAFLTVLLTLRLKTPQKPNIVIIVTDDQGYGDVGFNGNQMIHTPTMDSLAKKSIVFEKFYCFPHPNISYYSMFTGNYKHENKPNKKNQNLIERFQNDHYKTALFENNDAFIKVCDEFKNNELAIIQSESVPSTTDSVIAFINHTPDPFFTSVFYHQPNDLSLLHPEIVAKYSKLNLDWETIKAYLFFEEIDIQLSRIQDALNNQHHKGNTILLLVSSSGPQSIRFNNGLKGRKGQLNEGGLRVPMLIWYPNGPFKARRIENLNGSIMDIAPTLLALASIPFHSDSFDGINLVPLVQTEKKAPDRYLYFQTTDNFSNCSLGAIRYNNFLLTCSITDTLLYDLDTDPSQRKNIVDANLLVKENLITQYQKWIQEKQPSN